MYRQPGSQITQVQTSLNVSTTVADLESGIIGPAYEIVNLTDYSYAPLVPVSTGFDVVLSGLDTTKALDATSIYAEFVSAVGEVVPFVGTITSTDSLTAHFIPTSMSIFPRAGNNSMNTYKPRIAFRALYLQRSAEFFVETADDITSSAGSLSSLNPLGMAASVMLQNTSTSFRIYPTSGIGLIDFSNAFNALQTSDMYAVAVLAPEANKSSIFGLAESWASNRSLPVNSRPTKLYLSPTTVWYNWTGIDSGLRQLSTVTSQPYADSVTTQVVFNPIFDFPLYKLPTTAKKLTAENIAAASTQVASSRVTCLTPDFGWIQETRHVLQTNPTYVSNTSGVTGGICVLAQSLVLADGTALSAGTIISSAVFTSLVGTTVINGNTVYQLSSFQISVWVPVPGYLYAVQQAALVSKLSPSDPKTGQPVFGIDKVDFSENFFGTEVTNIIAGGGTNVIVQPTLSVRPASRHHLTTDMTTIESREDNIVHQLDVITINYRVALNALTGRYKQNPRYYSLLFATLNGFATKFITLEYAKDVKIVSVNQSATQPDKVLVVISVLPFYASNYIDVTLLY